MLLVSSLETTQFAYRSCKMHHLHRHTQYVGIVGTANRRITILITEETRLTPRLGPDTVYEKVPTQALAHWQPGPSPAGKRD